MNNIKYRTPLNSDEFEKLRYNYQNNIYEDDYSGKMMDVAIQIYLRKILILKY